jgi:hypothetical protein
MATPRTKRGRTETSLLATLNPDTLPDRYILHCIGNCMMPDVKDGAPILVDKRQAAKAGELAVLYFKPGHEIAGQPSILKRLVMAPPPYVTFPFKEHPKSEVHAVVILEMTNPQRRFVVECQDLLAIHRCLGPLPSDATYDSDTRSWRLP